MRWSSYAGGERNDDAACVAVGSDGRAYVAVEGGTESGSDLRLGIIDMANPSNVSFAIVATNALVAALAIDRNGRAIIGGRTASRDWPVTADAIEPVMYGDQAGFVLVVAQTDFRVLYSSYIGRVDAGVTGVASGDAANFYATGVSAGSGFPPGPESAATLGFGFVASIDVAAPPPSSPRIRAVVNAAFSKWRTPRSRRIGDFVRGGDRTADADLCRTHRRVLSDARLGGVEMLANGAPVQLLYASRTQINATVPMLTDHPVIEIVVKNETRYYAALQPGTACSRRRRFHARAFGARAGGSAQSGQHPELRERKSGEARVDRAVVGDRRGHHRSAAARRAHSHDR